MEPHPSDSLSLDELFDLLSSQRRRHVLDFLSETSAPTTIDALADEVAVREANDQDEMSQESVSRIRTTLHHSHVPKLVDHGVLDHDELAESVVPGENIEDATRLLDAARANRTSVADSTRLQAGTN
ncbi:DUF7344 domain-containing protein [Halorussus halophilus]|uniref:DUF7344 domain-containing protein n=1 Tax=Halorussus halophilus TaxID=2650975 RepID=UPI0013015D2D|nr:hypothetical protein [Halorussus halophilus]